MVQMVGVTVQSDSSSGGGAVMLGKFGATAAEA